MTSPRAAEMLERSGELIRTGKVEEGIHLLEGAADRGLVDPDLSFNRGLSYLTRAETPQATPGDLGQAIAGFSESLSLRPLDAEATRGLERAQILLRQQNKSEETTLTLDGSILGQVLTQISPLPLTIIAGLGATLILVAWVVRFWAKDAGRALALLLIGLTLWAGGALVYGARSYALATTHEAIVIAARAELRDAAGRPMRGARGLPEGTRVRLMETRGRWSRIGSDQGELWVDAAELRRLPGERH